MYRSNRLNRLTRWLCATALATTCALASAQAFPSRPVRLVVPFPPGGSADLIARTIAPRFGELLGGHLNIAFGTMPLLEQYVRTGKMKAIAMLSRMRNPQYPKLPAAAETVPGFEASTWFGLLAPAGTPRDVVARLHGEIVRTLADDKTREKLASRGFEVVGSTPDALATFMQQQSQASARLVRSAGIKPE
jgi:tripartite-type tricarboxylate transporter receptor subunit TctC